MLHRDGRLCYLRTFGRFLPETGRRGTYLGVVIDAIQDNLRRQDLEAAHARQRHDALHDALTGLPNRRSFDEWRAGLKAPEAAAGIAGNDKDCPIFLVDLDHFKQINDQLGHAAGDRALPHAASVLRSTAPDRARVNRMGGDEFLMVPRAPPGPDALADCADAMIDGLSLPVMIDGEMQFSASIGISTSRCDAPSVRDGCARADRALYDAKAAGRGRALMPLLPMPQPG